MITLHAYGTWLPDRPEGYRHHTKGSLAPSEVEAKLYRQRQTQPALRFSHVTQRILVESALTATTTQKLRSYFIATHPTHAHFLLGWRRPRLAERVRDRLKQSLSRDLNRLFGHRRWFVRNGWLERVSDEKHFDYLTDEYLPSHPGWAWERSRGWMKPVAADREPLARG